MKLPHGNIFIHYYFTNTKLRQLIWNCSEVVDSTTVEISMSHFIYVAINVATFYENRAWIFFLIYGSQFIDMLAVNKHIYDSQFIDMLAVNKHNYGSQFIDMLSVNKHIYGSQFIDMLSVNKHILRYTRCISTPNTYSVAWIHQVHGNTKHL